MSAATESANTEASTTTTEATTETQSEASTTASPEQKKKALRERLVAKAAGLVVSDDVPIKPKAKPEGEDGKQAKAKDKPDPKAKDADGKAKGEGDEDKPEGDEKELVKGWRDLRRAKKKFEATQQEAATRIKRAEELERRQTEQAEAFEKDPLGWLKARGKNVREVLLRVAREDGEDPKDKTLREVKTKAEELEKKLTEREQREQEREAEERARAAQQKLQRQILEEYEAVDSEEYPTLAAHLEPAQVAEAARDLLLRYYKEHDKELSPRELFVRLETALRLREERREARLKKSGKSDGAGAPRSPDRGRAAARGRAGNLEDDAERTPRRPADDVTSRETRLATTRPAGGEDKAALRRRLVSLAAERIVS